MSVDMAPAPAPDLLNPPPENTPESKYPDLRTLWSSAIVRTCGPNNGVCHNSRQFPELASPSGLLATVGTRCNQLRDNPKTVDNLCEPKGDSLLVGSGSTHIGQVIGLAADGTPVADGVKPDALKITLHDAISDVGMLRIERQTASKVDLQIPQPAVRSANMGDSFVVLDYALTPVPIANFLWPAQYRAGDDSVVALGDANGDGIFGADLGGALIKPGDATKSYLFLRLSAPLSVGPGHRMTNVIAPPSEEAQMPIANNQYWDAENAATALYCWITTMDPKNPDGAIDYAHCDRDKMPQIVHQAGEASTWSSVYSNVLEPMCSSCHHPGTSEPTQFFIEDAAKTYATLLYGRATESQLPFVEKGDPSRSLLYLKLTGQVGTQMPLGGMLDPKLLDGVSLWIAQGANNN
jgi:hypothetical protein